MLIVVLLMAMMVVVIVASDNQSGLIPHDYQASVVLASPAYRSHDGEEEHHREYDYHGDGPGWESCALLAEPKCTVIAIALIIVAARNSYASVVRTDRAV